MICPDVAGRGDSAWLASPMQYHFGQFLADIRTLLAKLGVQQVDWVGTSMGGLLGLMLASQPGSPIRRLVMNDIGAYVPLDALRHIGRDLQAPEGFASLDEVEAHMRAPTASGARSARSSGSISPCTDRGKPRTGIACTSTRGSRGWRNRFPSRPGLFFWDAWYRVRCPVLLHARRAVGCLSVRRRSHDARR